MYIFRMKIMILIHTVEGGGKIDWNSPVVDEEVEGETLGPKRWSKDEDEDDEEEPDTDFFLSITDLFNLMLSTCLCVYTNVFLW